MDDHTIVIIDYGVGNHQSVANALDTLGCRFVVSNKEEDIVRAESYILPGIGAFEEAITNFRKLNIIDLLTEQVQIKKKPLLGICLGMQLLADYSEENGRWDGLGWIEGGVVAIEPREDYRVPHVGWNNIIVTQNDPMFSITEESHNFYFDHSYHFNCKLEYISATCSYGSELVAAVQKDNVFGVQFHPEKSQSNGLKLFRSFFNYVEILN